MIGRWIAVCATLSAGPVLAQSLTFAPTSVVAPGATSPLDGQAVDPANAYIRTLVPTGRGSGSYEQFIRLSDLYARLPAGPAGPPGPQGPQGIQGPAGMSGGLDSAALVAIAGQLDRITRRLEEGIALAGAINILPPNPGDRFAVSFGGAGYGGAGAGSIAISARIDESTLAYVGYARGPTQGLVKGGLGFSFR
ncbi:YadA-like family protein [Methylobacterium cerastii]|uniref:YadA-like family protein n=1 Tax=Methylobacterium cerastii TaxID=932741 RepID=UPI0035713B92